MENKYGRIQYIWDTHEGIYVYVYGIVNNVAKASFENDIPKYYLIRTDKHDDKYFNKYRYKVFLKELEEIY